MNNSSKEGLVKIHILFLAGLSTWNSIIGALITLTGLITNGLLLLALFKDPLKCFRNPTSYFIMNLAISDSLSFLVILEEICVHFITHYDGIFDFTTPALEINIAVVIFAMTLTFPSVFGLALERCLAIFRPLWHKVHITSTVCRKWIMILWLVNVVPVTFVMIDFIQYRRLSIFLRQATSFSMFFFFMATQFFYVVACVSIRRQRKTLSTEDSTSETARRAAELRLKSHKRFLNTVFIVNLFQVFCLLPVSITPILLEKNDSGHMKIDSNWLAHVMDITYFIGIGANPFIYLWRLPKYRKTFNVLYFKC